MDFFLRSSLCLFYLLSISHSDQHKAQPLKQSQLPYPWNQKVNFDTRQERILEILRNEPISFFIHEDIAPIALHPAYKNSSEELGRLFFRNEAGETVEITSTSSEELEHRKKLEYQEQVAKDLTPIERINAMPKICLIFQVNSDDYWMFEWCHRKMVRQLHLEPDPMNPHQVNRQPDWSLGSYVSTDIIRHGDDQTDESAPIKKVIDYYENGQHCDETGNGRMSQVHFQCCAKASKNQPQQHGSRVSEEHIHRMMVTDERGIKPPVLEEYRIHHVHESSLCQYEVGICMESLCSQHFDKDDTSASASSGGNIAELDPRVPSASYDLTLFMGHINNTCLFRQEDWWTYELCFNKGIRQYHSQITAIQQPDGKIIQAAEIHSEFFLGYPPLPVYEDLAALTAMTAYGSTNRRQQRGSGYPLHGLGMPPPKMNSKLHPDDGMNRLLLEFTNGTRCDVKDTMRSSTVEIACGPRDLIKDIKEDRTCHYIVYVESPMICKIPSFEPEKTKTLQINLSVLDKDGKPSTQEQVSSIAPIAIDGDDDHRSIPMSAGHEIEHEREAESPTDSEEILLNEGGVVDLDQYRARTPMEKEAERIAREHALKHRQAMEHMQIQVEMQMENLVFLDDDADDSFLLEGDNEEDNENEDAADRQPSETEAVEEEAEGYHNQEEEQIHEEL
jgi:hypothetical protein